MQRSGARYKEPLKVKERARGRQAGRQAGTSFEQAQTAAGQASCARRQKAQTQNGNGVEMRQDEARIALAKGRKKEGRNSAAAAAAPHC